jgi:Mg2+ and Co2+ transporter CorA
MHFIFFQLYKQIPGYLFVFLGVLLLLMVRGTFRMWRQGKALRATFKDLSDLVGESQDESDVLGGIPLARLEEIRGRSRELAPQVRTWWHRLEHHLEPYQGSGKEREFFLARPARDVLPEVELFEALYDGPKFQALPGILTSLGLAGTFFAILMGLLYVTYNQADPTQPVRGIDQLINNLSGKFASSLVALGLSILFIFLEKRAEKRNRIAYDKMITRLEDTIPLLTPVRVLVDIQAASVEQKNAIKNISSDMTAQFCQAFTADINPALSQQFSQQLMTELQPTLVRMTDTLGDLQATIQKLETRKHDNLLKELTVVIQAMHGSIVESLQGMGTEFHQALSGSAKQELDGMQQSMESAREVLDAIGGRLQGTMQGFSGAAEQQVFKLNQTVEDLNKRMEQMGAQMVETLGAVQLAAQEQSRDSIERLGHLATTAQRELEATITRTNGEVSQLLGAVGDGTKGFAQAVDKLTRAQSSVQTSIEQHLEALEQFAEIGKGMGELRTGLKEVADRAKAMVGTQSENTIQIQVTLDQLATLQQGNMALLNDFVSSFNASQSRLGELDQDLAKAFGSINEGMRTWTVSVDACLKGLTTQTNEHLAGVSRVFSRQMQDLGEKLEDFSEVLDRAVVGAEK